MIATDKLKVTRPLLFVAWSRAFMVNVSKKNRVGIIAWVFILSLFFVTFFVQAVEFNVTLPACFDALDNDDDALVDYPADSGCTDRADNDEFEPVATVLVAPVLPEPTENKNTIGTIADNIQNSKTYQVIDKQVLNNPRVEKATTQVAAPIIVTAVAVNTVTAVATAGVSMASILTYLQGFLTQPFLLFTRRRRAQWGIVYSSLAKVPIDLAVVRLFSIPAGGAGVSAGRLLQTRVTDKQGRYLFIASPGTYRMEVAKSGFLFPSVYLKDKASDVDFVDLYHGGPLTVTDSSTIIRPVPIDPVEKAETSKEVLSRKRKRIFQTSLAYSGPIFAVVSVVITPTLTTIALFGFQLLMLGLFKRLAQGSKPRSFASVRDAQTGKPIVFAVARIFDSTFNKLLETQITDKDGRYGFLVGQGTFYITVEKPGYEPYRSGTMDLTKAESAEIVKRDIRLRTNS